jgi:hypothetical protein
MDNNKKLIEPSHIGDGLYFTDADWEIVISVNHHENYVATLSIENLDKAIEYLLKVKQRIEKKS